MSMRRLCPACAHPIDLEPHMKELLKRLCPGAVHVDQLFDAPGCGECGASGVHGRVGVYDLLVVGESMSMGAEGLSDPRALRQLAERGGSCGLVPDALDKARTGKIGVEGLLEIASRACWADPALAA